jgi:ubiquinone/menaquinone biosynthesis C-methylase UbiE
LNPNYNSTSLFYDRLSSLLFGNALINAQVYLLKYIPPGSSVIIVGGGTGWILEEIAKVHPSGLTITYVEISEKMMRKSMKRFTGKNTIHFVKDDIKKVIAKTPYDVVITPFFFDNFSQKNAEDIFKHIHNLVKPGGIWLYCDFQLTGKWWQMVLLKCMLIFFRIMCNMEADSLPNTITLFSFCGYTPVAQETFFSDFVISMAYQSSQKL